MDGVAVGQFATVSVNGNDLRIKKTEKNADIIADGTIDAAELESIASNDKQEGFSLRDFKEAGFDPKASAALMAAAGTGEKSIGSVGMSSTIRKSDGVQAILATKHTITRDSLEAFLGAPLNADNTAKGGALEQKMLAAGIPKDKVGTIMNEVRTQFDVKAKEAVFASGESLVTETGGMKLVPTGEYREVATGKEIEVPMSFDETYEAAAQDNGTQDWNARYAVKTETPEGAKALTAHVREDFGKIIAKFKGDPAGFEAALQKGFPGAFKKGEGTQLLILCMTAKSPADVKKIQVLLAKIPVCSTFMNSNGGIDSKYGKETTRAVRALDAFLGGPVMKKVPEIKKEPIMKEVPATTSTPLYNTVKTDFVIGLYEPSTNAGNFDVVKPNLSSRRTPHGPSTACNQPGG